MVFPADVSLIQQPQCQQSLEEHLASAAHIHDEFRQSVTPIRQLERADYSYFSSALERADSSANSFNSPYATPTASPGSELHETAEILCFMASGNSESNCFFFDQDHLLPSVYSDSFVNDHSLDTSMDTDPTSADKVFEDCILSTGSCTLPNALGIYDCSFHVPELPLLNFHDGSNALPPISQGLLCSNEDWSFIAEKNSLPSEVSTPSSTSTIGFTTDDFGIPFDDYDFNSISTPEHDYSYYLQPFDHHIFHKFCHSGASNGAWSDSFAFLATSDSNCDSFEGLFGNDAAEGMLTNANEWMDDSAMNIPNMRM